MNFRRPSHLAGLAAAGTVLLWASAFPAIAVAVRTFGPAGLAVARLGVASAVLLLVAPWLGVRMPRARDLPLIALCGLAGMTGYQVLLNAGERVVPAGTASLLIATAPVYASLLAVAFLGEHATRRRWAGSAIALAGTAVIAVSHGLGFGTSALIVLAAAVLQAVFHTAQKPLLARYTGFEVTAYAMWAGTVFILPWTGSLLGALPHAGGAAIGSAIFLGVAPSAAGFAAWAYAMARMDVGRATLSLYLVPATAILISLVWLGQVPGPVELAGGVVALGGVVLASTRARRPAPSPDPEQRGPGPTAKSSERAVVLAASGTFGDPGVQVHVVPAVGVQDRAAQGRLVGVAGLVRDPAGRGVRDGVQQVETMQAQVVERPAAQGVDRLDGGAAAARGGGDPVGDLRGALAQVDDAEGDAAQHGPVGDGPGRGGFGLPAVVVLGDQVLGFLPGFDGAAVPVLDRGVGVGGQQGVRVRGGPRAQQQVTGGQFGLRGAVEGACGDDRGGEARHGGIGS
jgi:drug/metabolite transporter (DMT)-like permease